MINKSLCRHCKNFGNGCDVFPTGMTEIEVKECNDFRRGSVNKAFKSKIDQPKKDEQ
jgi:hypothetical protein